MLASCVVLPPIVACVQPYHITNLVCLHVKTKKKCIEALYPFNKSCLQSVLLHICVDYIALYIPVIICAKLFTVAGVIISAQTAYVCILKKASQANI